MTAKEMLHMKKNMANMKCRASPCTTREGWAGYRLLQG